MPPARRNVQKKNMILTFALAQKRQELTSAPEAPQREVTMDAARMYRQQRDSTALLRQRIAGSLTTNPKALEEHEKSVCVETCRYYCSGLLF